MTRPNMLFCEEDLDRQLANCKRRVGETVTDIPKDQFLISTDEDLLNHLLPELAVEPLVLHKDSISMNQHEAEIDVSRDLERYLSKAERRRPYYVPGIRLEIDIPFTGAEWIFRFRTNPYILTHPCADILSGYLRLTISQPQEANTNSFKEKYEHEIHLIDTWIEAAHNQVEAYNRSLHKDILNAARARRERLNKHEDIAALLDIPIAAKAGAPSINSIKVEVKQPMSLPTPPISGLKPEPGIADKVYEQILRFIRHQGRTFERTPKTYSVHGEEGLRDIVLGQLNGQFEGDAVGEAFRGKGKTDICIEQEDRAAFVGECKIWTGPKDAKLALDQLMGYLTWRDSKAALIIFNTKNKDFSKVLEALPNAVREHDLSLKALDCSEQGEWRVLMRSAEDEGRRVTVHIFAFDLYQSG